MIRLINQSMKAFALPCLILLLSGCVVFGEDGENTPGSLSDPADTSDAADASDETDTSDSADTSDPSNTEPECSEETPCSDGFYCAEGECVPKESNGETCFEQEMCASGFCVDGVCCESACDGVCTACIAALTGSDNDNGSCAPIPSGEDPDDDCGAQQCDGASTCFDLQADEDCGFDYECGGALVCNLGICGENVCGDGVQRGQEECDHAGESETCDSDCTQVECGDEVVNIVAGEACDDGNDSNTDSCLNTCMAASCGDTFIRTDLESDEPGYETCDDGGESETCDIDCTAVECGDTTTNTTAGETCDDGNTSNNDACLNDCSTASCGDGYLRFEEVLSKFDPLFEMCDDGGNSENCDADCTVVQCGDGFLNPITEECDDDGLSSGCNLNCTISECGDGLENNLAGEECDDDNQVTEVCDYGQTSCEVCNSTCEQAPGETSYCGDGTPDPEEECDDGNQVTETCGYGEESCQVCASNCQYENGETTYCGDGEVDADFGETCDDGPDNSNSALCLMSCRVASCGDGFRLLGVSPLSPQYEACDDGNATDTDACLSNCSEAACGDGITRTDILDENEEGFESCDDYGVDTADCNFDCSDASCGDGYSNLAANEACDDGNTNNTDACLNTCVVASCGDGFTYEGSEDCDEGNGNSNTGACLLACINASCGDSFTRIDLEAGEAGYENCDDGNTITEACEYGQQSCQVCTNTCLDLPGETDFCGDGEIDSTHEDCDDTGESASCDVNCTLAECGDNTINATAGEECDNGASGDTPNSNAGACLLNCQNARCGDTFTRTDIAVGQPGYEDCDDGNTVTEECEYGLQACEVCASNCLGIAGETDFCGDGAIDSAHEDCDVGVNGEPTESAQCDSDCTSAICGDGNTNTSAGEFCDDGQNGQPTDSLTCNSDCTPQQCGDGYTNTAAGETCDDDNSIDTDACRNNCIKAACGDGVLVDILNLPITDPLYEACDEGANSLGSGPAQQEYGCPNCVNKICEGDFIVTENAPAALADCSLITGNLTISAEELDCEGQAGFCFQPIFILENLYAVEGNVSIVPRVDHSSGSHVIQDALSYIEIPNLRRIDGDLTIKPTSNWLSSSLLATLDNEYLGVVRLQNLQSVGGSVQCISNLELVEFNIQSLTNVGTNLQIAGNPKLCDTASGLGLDYETISTAVAPTVQDNKSTGCD